MPEEPVRQGTVEELDDGRWRLRLARALPHPREKVVARGHRARRPGPLVPDHRRGGAGRGRPLRFSFPGGQAPPFEGRMLACEPPRLMEFQWGTDVIRLELEEAAEGESGTILTLLDTLDERGKAARDAAGWHVCLDGLAAHLRGEPGARQEMAAWKDVHAGYVERLGPEAATIGPPKGFE